MKRVILSAVLTVALAFPAAASAQVAGPAPVPELGEDGKVKVDDVIPERREDGSRKRIKRRDLRKLLDRELSIIEMLENLQFGVHKKQAELEATQAERAKVEKELQEFIAKYEAEKSELAAHRVRIRKRLRGIRRLTQMESLHLVFSSGNFTDYLRRERLLGKLLEGDRERLQEYRQALAHFARTQEELKARRDELARVEAEIYDAKAQIEQDRSDHVELLRRVDEERAYYEKYHAELRRRSRGVAKKIKELEEWNGRAWFDAHKGKYAAPVNYASVAVPYGYRVHPRFKTKVLHRGITYRPSRVPEGKGKLAVRAIYTGRVMFADWLSGYGNTVIIDHAKGYYSVYSRLSKITVRKDEVLKSRERLGFIGQGGSLRNAELYFELRVNGKPTNPEPWLRSRK